MLIASQPVDCYNRFDCLPNGKGTERPNLNVEFSKVKALALLVRNSMI